MGRRKRGAILSTNKPNAAKVTTLFLPATPSSPTRSWRDLTPPPTRTLSAPERWSLPDSHHVGRDGSLLHPAPHARLLQRSLRRDRGLRKLQVQEAQHK